jgi:AraC-like DNA-binding protein
MKKIFLISLIFTSFCPLKAQTPDSLAIIARQIMDEATVMYKSEMASWYGTDLFMEKYKEKVKNAGGYFSYSEKGVEKCIFYSKGSSPKVLATIEFNGVYSVEAAKDDATEREFTELETQLYTIRALATDRVKSDTLFQSYKNMNFNLIPIVYKNQRKVYVLTGPKELGVVVLGNDYELNFDSKNALTSVRKIHKSILSFEYSDKQVAETAMHTHLESTGDFITVTDVCTLMLYGKTAKWKQHYVMSDKYVSIWNEGNNLLILTKEVWEKISKDQDKRNGKKKKN